MKKILFGMSNFASTFPHTGASVLLVRSAAAQKSPSKESVERPFENCAEIETSALNVLGVGLVPITPRIFIPKSIDLSGVNVAPELVDVFVIVEIAAVETCAVTDGKLETFMCLHAPSPPPYNANPEKMMIPGGGKIIFA